ncbi:GNAT family N-acetyltransferase [Candidatus Epulonipiscium viviparus]|uniref:GNAT family N-acetyltransferase n=1 Tax=Candidatus Epulonipiscium viviparus TaxID=420336 RepID=UPI0027380967|nr:GNAT family N-acetyltransferase [Candidatus Epulopiscium viviparus]
MIRKAVVEDAWQVDLYFNEARNYFKEKGVDQWQGSYPNALDVKEDSKRGNGYVVVEDEIVKAYFFLIFGDDPTYSTIYDGSWITDKSYGVLHRVVVGMKFRQEGIGSQIFAFAIEEAKKLRMNLRIDTHKDNIAMQKLIEKNEFDYCGIIYIGDGSARLAYEREIE